MVVGLAGRAVVGLGDGLAVEVQPHDRHLRAVSADLHPLAAGARNGHVNRLAKLAGDRLVNSPVVDGATVTGSGSRAGR